MTHSDHPDLQFSRVSADVASKQIHAFQRRFGLAHLQLAYHAALPLSLTPDLLYKLWANFNHDKDNTYLQIPWIAVADLLLSNLCRLVGHELYEMDPAIRRELLLQLENDPRFGPKRIENLAEFLLEYIKLPQFKSDDPYTRDFAQVQEWTALAYTNPEQSARKLAQAFAENKSDSTEHIRLASVVESLAQPNPEFTKLLYYARGMASLAYGEQDAAVTQFSQVYQSEQQEIVVAGVGLVIPLEIIRELRNWLLDFKWIQFKLNITDIYTLLADYQTLLKEGDEEVELVERALRHASHILAKDKKQLAGQLIGRLADEEIPSIRALLSHAMSYSSTLWLRPLQASLQEEPSLIRTLYSHTSQVTGVAVYDRWAISASSDHTLKVWDVVSGKEMHTLLGHTSWVNGVALSADGRWAISASQDRTLKVWDVVSGKEIRTLYGHTSWVNGVAVYDRWAISASSDHTLKVWDVDSGKEIHTLRGHISGVNGVALSADGRWAISASQDRTLKVWDVASGKEIHTLVGHAHRVSGVVLSADGRWAISTSWDKTLKVWNVASGQEIRTLAGHTSVVTGVATYKRWAISVSRDRTLKVWEVASGKEMRILRGHSLEVSGVAVNDSWVISASHDKTLKVWEVASGKQMRTIASHSFFVNEVVLSANGHRAISASSDHTLKVWDVASGKNLRTLVGHTDFVTGVALIADGDFAISVSLDKTLKVWDVTSGKEINTRSLTSPFLTGLVYGPWAIFISDKKLKVLQVASGQEMHTLTGHTDKVKGVALSANGRFCFSASRDKTVKVWEIASRKEIHTFTGHNDWVNGVALSADGRFCLSASSDCTLKVWEITSGQEIRTLAGHTDWVNGVAIYDPFCLSASSDHTLKVWDWQRGECLTTFDLNEELLTCAITPDGRTIAAAGSSGRVHFLQLEGMFFNAQSR